ncbi:Methyltransferase-like protein 7B [Cytospora mali]|uniref:Methyltransferase-like protein 7B n=1 Tax=Cytospora mali TaxID=578113 RepID=A0A194V3N3_CYTMA|nr:Methyltransferase-like protein 7B [Valsa mali var. pyri (nom. inval.)]
MTSPQENSVHGDPPSGLWARWDGCVGLSQRFRFAAWYYLKDVWARLRRGHINMLISNNATRDHAFAEFYQAVSKDFAAYEATTPVPSLVASAHGKVLELGPGTGIQLERFEPSRIEHVYGVEPNTAFFPAFTDRLRKNRLGQDGKYTLIPCGVEDEEALTRFGVVEGSLDCVVSIQVLCSVPDVEGQVQHMYKLLKPGGEFIFWEHCRNSDPVTRVVQWIWSLFWSPVFGGCRLDRVTKEALVGAADWERVEVEVEMLPENPMPRISGRLIKPRVA